MDRWRRTVAGLLAVGAVVLGSLGGARPAAAQEFDPIWFPSTWLEVAVGVGEAIQQWWTGEDAIEVPPSSESPVQSATPGDFTATQYGAAVYEVQFAGVDDVGQPMFRAVHTPMCGPYGCDWVNQAFGGWDVIDAFDAQGRQVTTSLKRDQSDGLFKVGIYFGKAPENPVSRIEQGYSEWVAQGSPGLSGGSAKVLPWRYDAGGTAEPAVITTVLWCRLDGAVAGDADIIWAEESEPGSTVVPRPVCPAGTYPVRVTVESSTAGVLTDASITAPDWYLSSPNDWDFRRGEGGAICVEGTPGCMPGDPWTASSQCYAVPRSGVGTGQVQRLATAVCVEAEQQQRIIVQPAPEPDLGPVERAIQRAGDAVGSAVGGLRAAVEGGLARLERLLVPDAGVVDGLIARGQGALGAPVQGWTNAIGQLAASVTGGGGSCQGPPFSMAEYGTYYPFSTCEGGRATIAAVVRTAIAGSFVVVGVLACGRLLSAALGLQTGKGGAA